MEYTKDDFLETGDAENCVAVRNPYKVIKNLTESI